MKLLKCTWIIVMAALGLLMIFLRTLSRDGGDAGASAPGPSLRF
jgi:hypothetical protein